MSCTIGSGSAAQPPIASVTTTKSVTRIMAERNFGTAVFCTHDMHFRQCQFARDWSAVPVVAKGMDE
jgi:hypothetical protein